MRSPIPWNVSREEKTHNCFFRALHPLYHTPPAPVHTLYSSIMPAPTLSTTTFHCPAPRLPPAPVRMRKPKRGIGGGCGSTEAGAAPVLPTCTRLFSGRSWRKGDLHLNTCQLVESVLSSPCLLVCRRAVKIKNDKENMYLVCFFTP